MKTLKRFFVIVDLQTLAVTLLGVLGTFLCMRFGIRAEIPTSLVGIAVVFPIVFSISAAYTRREEALKYLASMKAQLMNIYYSHRDWVPPENSEDGAEADRAREIIHTLLQQVRDFFIEGPEESDRDPHDIYNSISQLSRSVEDIRDKGAPNLSRTGQSIRNVVRDFEKMRNILEYRTPNSLRAYSSLFLNSFPVLFAPYLAFLGHDFHPSLGYFVAVFYSIVLVSLDNIQDDLENPFDRVGTDDLNVDVADEMKDAMFPVETHSTDSK
ncbi:MAG: hypothetical protein ABEJ65_08355 [bacterium]